MKNIIINGANQGNLQNISLEIPINKIVVFTGLSGCGKSTLAIDVIYQECQRQYAEASVHPEIQKPQVNAVENPPPAIRIRSDEYRKDPRASVGTVTNIYQTLRRLYDTLDLSRRDSDMDAGLTFMELSALPLADLMEWISKLEHELNEKEKALSQSELLDLKTKIQRVITAGLPYLTLIRRIVTLSCGEAQRMRLAMALDSQRIGVLYILEEPTVGLHPKDTAGLIEMLRELCKLGNTILIIEHDLDVMAAADYIVELGPGPGKHGGQIIGTGSLTKLRNQNISATGAYLRRRVHPSRVLRQGSGEYISVKNADLHNLKNFSVDFPVGCLTCVTGVSGAGKTTLVFDVLDKRGSEDHHRDDNVVSGLTPFQQIISIEQTLPAKINRSNVAAYCGAYAELQKIYGKLPNPIKQYDSSIKEILDLSIEEASEVFSREEKLQSILKLLKDMGLGYLILGQPLTSLTCGEAQRLKLAKELLRNKGKQTLYLMDEPTTGLHPIEVEKFLKILEQIVDAGNTVIVVEHNLQVINAADWIIDLGPGGGNHGGEIVAMGTPEEIKANPASETGKQLLRETKRPSRRKTKATTEQEPIIPGYLLDLL